MTDVLTRRDDVFRMVEIPAAQLEFRAAQDGGATLGTLHGYMAIFNDWTEIDSWEGLFLERIAPGAFKKTLREFGSRVKVLFNHGFDPAIGDKPLGKPSVLKEDERGLYIEVPLDDTSYNRDLVASLRSGALDGMSFRFSVGREEWEEPTKASAYNPKILPERTIREVARLYEGGPVTFPAYEATTAGVRGAEAYRAWRTAHPTKNSAEEADPESDAALEGTSENRDDTPPTVAPVENRRKKADTAVEYVNRVLRALGLDNKE
jgi:HK97 family phage prohead protease